MRKQILGSLRQENKGVRDQRDHRNLEKSRESGSFRGSDKSVSPWPTAATASPPARRPSARWVRHSRQCAGTFGRGAVQQRHPPGPIDRRVVDRLWPGQQHALGPWLSDPQTATRSTWRVGRTARRGASPGIVLTPLRRRMLHSIPFREGPEGITGRIQ
jgi:hypothetical protein